MENKRAVASVGVVTVFSGALVGLALWYDGEATAEVVLNDSGIWVTRAGQRELGRFNVEASAIDGIMQTASTSFDVSQDGGRVLLKDDGNSEASPVDPAHLEFAGALDLPAGAQAASGGATTAVYDGESGRLWVLPFDGAQAFDEEELDPTAEIGKDGVLAVGTDGTVYVATTAGDAELTSVRTGRRGAPGEVETERLDVQEGASLQVSAVGDRPVVLDRTAETLILPGGDQIHVSGFAEAQLQQPSGPSDTVAVATGDSLVSQPLDGGDALTQHRSGRPAAPVQVGGCTYGAWSGSGEVIRDCPGTDSDARQVLDGLSPDAVLQYRTNRGRIILNDVIGGYLWLPTDDYRKVDDWDQKDNENDEGEKSDSETTVYTQVDQTVADRDQPNKPPRPKPDDLGVRPGRTTVLDVLGNDMDPDGDVMTASVAGGPGEGSKITIHRVLDGAALQADVPPDAKGTITFTYQVDDGRENGTAEADVTLRVRQPDENEIPVEPSIPGLKVAQGGTGEIKVLPYFKDPDGDDLFLAQATTQDPEDDVRFRPDGTIEFLDGGRATGTKVIDVTVSDGTGAATGRVNVSVVADERPPLPVQDHVTTLVGEPVTVRPLENDSDPNGDRLRLTHVGDAAPAEITMYHTAGTFRFVSEAAGSYDIPYTVSDGPQTATGLVRVDVVEPPSDAGKPVVVTDQVLLPKGGEGLVDVLANDTDPAGGVLVVQEVDVPEDSGLTVAVLDHHVLKVTENRRLEAATTIGYTVSNGEATAHGQVQVVPIQRTERLRPPEAGADEVDVHVGDTVTIPVLKNDSHPDGLPITLARELAEEPDPSLGEAFVSQDVIRFKAGDEAGVAHAVYEVTDPNKQRGSAQITINVRDGDENTAPQLPDVTARVLQGGTVRIDVPLDGVDPDGDYTMLSDIAGAPTMGRARITDGFIDFEASPDAEGTDTFTYTATDSRGAVGLGTVRVGIAPSPETNQKPIAQDDETLVRPDRTVAIDALANDTDPDGDEIGLVESLFASTGDLDPQVEDDQVIVTAPGKAGEHPFYYGIQDSYKARAQAAITVKVSPDAPLLPPVANDDVLSIPDVAGKDSVTVDVLANDVDPDGVASELEVSTGAQDATLSEDGKITIPVTPDLQIVTYTVTDMDGLESSAFVRVPGDALTPHLKPGLDPLEATSGEPLEIDLFEYVVVEEGRKPRITEESKVSAVDGSVTVEGPTSLTYLSEDDYIGPASVSFEVTDGAGAEDPEGRKATLTLPIEVRATDNQPPEIKGSPVLEVPAGEENAVDLAAYVRDPENDTLTFELKGDVEGLSASVRAGTVTAQAEPSVTKGTSRVIPFTVTDEHTDPVPGELTVKVVASTRPLAVTGEDVVDNAHEGVAELVDVLVNDNNPFPEVPLELVGVPVVETGKGTAEYRGDQVAVQPEEGFHGAMRVKYTVQDATKDPDRQVDGVINLTVLGKPEAPRAPRVEEVRSETVVLSWDEPNNNGAPIESYTVTSSQGDEQRCPTTTCTVTGLTNNVTYTFTVRAENEVGLGDPSPQSQEARPDEKPDQPAPPQLVFGDQSLEVSWTNRTYSDRSQIECVNLEISPAPPNSVTQKRCLATTSTTWEGLENGTAYTVRVQAKNEAPDPSEWSDPSAPEVPAGPPEQPAPPTATRVNTNLGGQINVNWTAPANNGDAIKDYDLDVLEGGSTVRTLEAITGTSQTVQSLDPKKTYTFRVLARNKAGDSEKSAQSNAVQPYGTPDRPAAPSASLIPGDTSGKASVTWSAVGSFRGTGGYYEVRSSPATSTRQTTGTTMTFTGLSNGTTYTFSVRACNDKGACSVWSGESNSVKPYTTPGTPGVTWYKDSATDGHFTVRNPGSNGGSAVTKIEWVLSGSQSGSGSKTSGPFDINVNGGYDKNYTLKARACNQAGCGAYASASGSTDAAPNPAARVVHGSSVSNSQCSDASCAYFKINYSDFPSGNHRVECWAGTNPDTTGWHNIIDGSRSSGGAGQTLNFGGSGTKQLNCYYGYPGTSVAVVIDGTRYQSSSW
ncbi:fibronectin type III domain-containing protein [Myceligenerans sp. I2]|uniref:Fibronectin type III domain-containing protein n=2 Tax=Myceligenerans indicum TaxID=2593663 RepID=A0ABS1LI01_9MICO|nr:fibronectin type III domain-containing protein [Myceligenerans indicum]